MTAIDKLSSRLQSMRLFIRPREFDPQWLLRAGTVVGVLGLSALLALRPSKLYLYALGGVCGAAILLRWPPLGLLALVVASMFVPGGIGTGSESVLNVSMIIVAGMTALWVLELVLRRNPVRRVARPVFPLLCLVSAAALSFVIGNQPLIARGQVAPLRAQIGAAGLYVLSAAVFLLGAYQVRDLRWLQATTWTYIALGGVFIASIVLPRGWALIGRHFQSGADTSLLWVWLAALAFGQAAFNNRLHVVWRLLMALIVLGVLYVGMTVGRTWTSGWLPALIAVAATLCVAGPRFAVIGGVAGAGFIATRWQSVYNFVMVGDNNNFSMLERTEAWRLILGLAKTSPIFGLGPANYYWYTPMVSILGYNVNFNSHNQYVDLIAQTGVLGLAFYLWFFLELAVFGWRLRSRVPEGFPRAYVFGVMGGIAGTLAAGLLGDWVIPFVYNIGLRGFRATGLAWLFMGGLLAVEALVPASATGEKGA